MAYPIDDLTNTNLDDATDDPSQARSEINNAVLKIKAMIAATGSGSLNALKLDSNGDIPSGVSLATALAIAGGGTGAVTAAQALINLGILATALQLNYNNISTLGIAEAQKVLTTNASNNSNFGGFSFTPFSTAGTAAAYTAAIGITALDTGRVYKFRIHITNSGAASLDIDSLGIKTIVGLDNGALSAGDLEIGQVADFYWDGSFFKLLNAQVSGSGGVPAFRGALVYLTSQPTITGSNVINVVNWQASTFNTDSIWNSVTNPNRLTVPAGVTRIKIYCSIEINGDTTSPDHFLVTTRKNGAVNYAGASGGTISADTGTKPITFNSTSFELNVIGGDYFDLYVSKNGATNKFLAHLNYRSQFGMEVIA
ncbi:MAG: hypothetical protein ACC657_05565 [Thiohalomonadales bacterium]